MPDFNAAQAEAITTARKNGFVSGGSISVTVTQKDERRIAVTIEDDNVRRYFSSLFISTMSITQVGDRGVRPAGAARQPGELLRQRPRQPADRRPARSLGQHPRRRHDEHQRRPLRRRLPPERQLLADHERRVPGLVPLLGRRPAGRRAR